MGPNLGELTRTGGRKEGNTVSLSFPVTLSLWNLHCNETFYKESYLKTPSSWESIPTAHAELTLSNSLTILDLIPENQLLKAAVPLERSVLKLGSWQIEDNVSPGSAL